METNQLTANLSLEQAKRTAADGYTPTQGLDLNIIGIGPQPIAAIDILVHGFSNRGQIMPASQIPKAAVDSPFPISASPSAQSSNRSGPRPTGIEPTESFHLTRGGSGASLRTSIVARGMMGISWIGVTRVEFADGSTWQPTSDEECRFAPSLYVPVDLAR